MKRVEDLVKELDKVSHYQMSDKVVKIVARHVLIREMKAEIITHEKSIANLDPYFVATTLYRKCEAYHRGCIADLTATLKELEGNDDQ